MLCLNLDTGYEMFLRDLGLRITNKDAEWQPRYIEITAMLFITALLLNSILAPKIISIGFLTISAATLVYPLACIFGDALTEVYGFNRTRRIIWAGFICLCIMTFFTWLAIILPADGSYIHQDAFSTVLGSMPRMVASAFTAYVFCELINSFIMSKMKIWSGGKHFPLRAIVSTIAAQAADSIIFFTMAFWGVLSGAIILKLVLTTWIVKSLYEFFALPFTIWFVHFLKAREGVEHFDNQELHVLKF
jgi:uncharacterized integral membrane protein (TIGR00697 family)